MYKLTWNNEHVIRLADNAFIPVNESNVDYQEYLKWVDAGGVPLPADPLDTSVSDRADSARGELLDSLPVWAFYERAIAISTFEAACTEVTDLPTAKQQIDFLTDTVKKLINFVYVYRDRIFPDIM